MGSSKKPKEKLIAGIAQAFHEEHYTLIRDAKVGEIACDSPLWRACVERVKKIPASKLGIILNQDTEINAMGRILKARWPEEGCCGRRCLIQIAAAILLTEAFKIREQRRAEAAGKAN